MLQQLNAAVEAQFVLIHERLLWELLLWQDCYEKSSSLKCKIKCREKWYGFRYLSGKRTVYSVQKLFRCCFASEPMALEASLPLPSVVTATPGHINNRLITSKLTGGKEEALPLAFHPKMANLRNRKFPLGIVKLTGRVVAWRFPLKHEGKEHITQQVNMTSFLDIWKVHHLAHYHTHSPALLGQYLHLWYCFRCVTVDCSCLLPLFWNWTHGGIATVASYKLMMRWMVYPSTWKTWCGTKVFSLNENNPLYSQPAWKTIKLFTVLYPSTSAFLMPAQGFNPISYFVGLKKNSISNNVLIISLIGVTFPN